MYVYVSLCRSVFFIYKLTTYNFCHFSSLTVNRIVLDTLIAPTSTSDRSVSHIKSTIFSLINISFKSTRIFKYI